MAITFDSTGLSSGFCVIRPTLEGLLTTLLSEKVTIANLKNDSWKMNNLAADKK